MKKKDEDNSAQINEKQPKRGKKQKTKIKPTDIVKPAPIPSEEAEKIKQKPKGLPSHWGPKVIISIQVAAEIPHCKC